MKLALLDLFMGHLEVSSGPDVAYRHIYINFIIILCVPYSVLCTITATISEKHE